MHGVCFTPVNVFTTERIGEWGQVLKYEFLITIRKLITKKAIIHDLTPSCPTNKASGFSQRLFHPPLAAHQRDPFANCLQTGQHAEHSLPDGAVGYRYGLLGK
jgi:hypothetical protein